MKDKIQVRGLPIPELLKTSMIKGQWKHPGNKILNIVIPFFKDEVIFLKTFEEMESASHNLCEDLVVRHLIVSVIGATFAP